jgi:hypothetical protein
MNQQDLRMPLSIHLIGPAVEKHRLPLDQLTLFAGQLQVAVHRIGRILSGESFSLAPGPVPKEIREACTLELVAIGPGSLSLVCDLPIDASSVEQLLLFKDAAGEGNKALGERSLEAFVEGISLVGSEGSQLPHGFDKGVLLALRESGRLFSFGINTIDFELQCRNTKRLNSSYTPQIYERIIARIQDPVINKASIEGRLLMGDFRESAYACRIHPKVGKPIRCTFGEEQKEALLAAMTRSVRLVGETSEVNNEIKSFKIEDIEILDTEQFASGQEFHPFFDSQIDLDVLAAEQGVPAITKFSQLRADFWPKDESVDEFLDAVRIWRREDLPSAS